MSTAALPPSPHATAEALWRFVYRRKCRVGKRTKPGIYGATREDAERVVAKQFGLTLKEVKARFAEFGKKAGKGIKYVANRLYAWRSRRDARYPGVARAKSQRQLDGNRPSRSQLRQIAGYGGFTTRAEPVPGPWREFTGVRPDDRRLLAAIGK